MIRSVARLGTNKKYYESTAVFSKFLNQETIDKLKNYIFFRPNDTHDLHQAPPANVKMPGVDRIQGYRTPAPGTASKGVSVPELENEDMKYDIKYFSRNTRTYATTDAHGNSTVVEGSGHVENNVAVIEHEVKQRGSSGVHGTEGAVKAYDPTGLRSAMTASHEETYKSVMKHMPTHLVKWAWNDHVDEVIDVMEKNGLPPIPGLNMTHIVKAGIVIDPNQQF